MRYRPDNWTDEKLALFDEVLEITQHLRDYDTARNFAGLQNAPDARRVEIVNLLKTLVLDFQK